MAFAYLKHRAPSRDCLEAVWSRHQFVASTRLRLERAALARLKHTQGIVWRRCDGQHSRLL
eukprot:1158898-Pelagomonas_calceolata.AAC.7